MALMKLCRAPGCDEIAAPGQSRCPEHARRAEVAESARKAAAKLGLEARAGGRLYHNAAWRRARAGHLARHPLCVHCLEIGVVTAANEMDHIKPHRGNLALFWARDNWQSLCKPCHSRKTASETMNRAPGG